MLAPRNFCAAIKCQFVSWFACFLLAASGGPVQGVANRTADKFGNWNSAPFLLSVQHGEQRSLKPKD
jgi:hypothetical protein